MGTDVIDGAKAKLISIYRGSQNINKLMDCFFAYPQKLNDSLRFIPRLDIDVALGKDLDNLGKIIGVPRPEVGHLIHDVFVYTDPGHKVTERDGGYGDGYYGGGSDKSATTPMTDAPYRRILKAKVILNGYNGSIDAMLLAVSAICDGNPKVSYEIVGPCRFKITINKELSHLELAIFSGSINPPIETGSPSVGTFFDTFVYPKPSGVWMEIDCLNMDVLRERFKKLLEEEDKNEQR